MNKRFFGGRSISAFLFDGTEKYRKTGQGGPTLEGTGLGGDDGAVAEKERERLEKYAEWLERDGKEHVEQGAAETVARQDEEKLVVEDDKGK